MSFDGDGISGSNNRYVFVTDIDPIRGNEVQKVEEKSEREKKEKEKKKKRKEKKEKNITLNKGNSF